jgi:hypothetical protein
VDDLGYVVGGDFPKLFGVGVFGERLVVAMDDVWGVAGPTRGFAPVFIGGVNSPLSLPLSCILMAKPDGGLRFESLVNAGK